MKKEFYDKNRNCVTSKVMQFILGLLILDGIVILLLFIKACQIVGISNF